MQDSSLPQRSECFAPPYPAANFERVGVATFGGGVKQYFVRSNFFFDCDAYKTCPWPLLGLAQTKHTRLLYENIAINDICQKDTKNERLKRRNVSRKMEVARHSGGKSQIGDVGGLRSSPGEGASRSLPAVHTLRFRFCTPEGAC